MAMSTGGPLALAGPVGRVAGGGLTRRRLQTIVIGLVLLVSCAASVLALGLVVESQSPFDRAFAAQHGADVTAAINPGRASAAQLAATTHLPGVTAAAGPYDQITTSAQIPGPPQLGGGTVQLSAYTVAGRASPTGPVDQLVLQSGHWPTGLGQIVMAEGQSGPQISLSLGSKIKFPDLPGDPTLTVVGTANSVTGSADAWVLPAEIARLSSPSVPVTEQMLYRFASASTQAALRADVAALTSALPAGAVAGTQNYLAARYDETSAAAPFVPFLVAFGVLGLVMSVLITANVVSSAVVAGYRRIGVLKSIGFTPGQVVAAYTGQVLVSAVVGCIAGVVLGNILAIPVLAQTASVFQVGALHVPVWVDVTVPVVMCCLVAIAAVLPAVRAGRLSAVQAIATGRAPRTGHGYAAHRLLGRLPLPRATTIGLAAPFARPARTAMTMTAIVLGATAVTLAVGLTSSLNDVVQGLSHANAEPVQLQLPGGGPGGPGIVVHQACPPGEMIRTPGGSHVCGDGGSQPSASAAQRAVQAAVTAQSGTAHYVAEANQQVSVAGLSQAVSVTAFRGNATWTGYDLISGHWYTGPDQVLVSTRFLTVTGHQVGDMVTLDADGKQVPVRIVGQIFDARNNGLAMLTDWRTLASAEPGLAPDTYEIGLRPGTSATAYASSLQTKLGSNYFVGVNDDHSQVLQVMLALIGTLTLLLAIVAGLGVLNTVVLNTRERVHDLGVFKVIGMTPRQTTAMAVCWVAGIGLIAGVIAVPAGIALHRVVLPAMANSVDIGLPPSYLAVYHGVELSVLALAGVAIAIAGALLPASWAAAIRTGAALRAE
jgi:putative ABC transport system permease protein